MKKPLVLGKYLLLERVNVGGMAEVFIAKTFGVGGFEQILAVKKILPNMAEDEEFIKMFIDEARVSVLLNHPNIVHIHDLHGKDDSYYIVMEYVSGRDLRSVLERFRRRKELMPIPMAAYVTAKMCEGLDHAHRKKDVKGMDLNIVHRDVSPQNILLSYEGELKLIDFGIARTAIRSTKTEAGVIKGKFGYMSPEQACGLPVDRRSDVFAAAVILYEMLTGEKLFAAESDFSTLEKVRKAEFRPPRQLNANIPPALEEVLLHALARKVENRYQWASEFYEALEKFTFAEDGKFSPKHLSFMMKELFADEYTRETNKLKHYAGLVAPDALLPEEWPEARPANGHTTRTPSGQKKLLSPDLSFEDGATIVAHVPLGVPPPPRPEEAPRPEGFRPSAENLSPIQLLPGAPVYTGDTMVGREAEGIFAQTAELPMPSETADTARRVPAVAVPAQAPASADEKASPEPLGAKRFPAKLSLGLLLAALLSVVLVLLFVGDTPATSGRLVALSTPADIPLELVLVRQSTGREQRFVSDNQAIVLAADTYGVEVNPLNKNYRLSTESAGPSSVNILPGEDFFMAVHLQAEAEVAGPPVLPLELPRLPELPQPPRPLQPPTVVSTVAPPEAGHPGEPGPTLLAPPGTAQVPQPPPPASPSKPPPASPSKSPPAPPSKPLPKAPSKVSGKVVISTEPSGAEIWVNGQKTAYRTPRSFSNPLLLPEGRHTLLFKAGGRQSAPQEVHVTAAHANTPLMLRSIRIE